MSQCVHKHATRYCVNCGLSVGQCRDLFFSRLSSSRGWTTSIRHSPAFHHISCHGRSEWWTPPLGSSLSSSRFQHITPLLRQLHWLKDCIQTISPRVQVSTRVRTCIPYWWDLSGGRCRGSSATPFQFILIVSRTRLLTVGDRTFPVAAARVLNSLPDLVTSAPSVAVFRSRLETHLFNISYSFPLWLYSACAVTL